MPNIVLKNGDLAGFIDLDGAGIADWYVDIAIFFRSLRRNSHIVPDLELLFCEAYGLRVLDRTKLEFYSMIDDLF